MLIAWSSIGVTQRTSIKAEEANDKSIDILGIVEITLSKSTVLIHIGWYWKGRRKKKYASYIIILEGN